MVALAESRLDIFAFLNSRLSDEKASTNSTKATNIVNYKKNTLASTSFYAAMYAPHVNYQDVYNSRTIKIGADAKVIPGWLNVINSLNYPYAYAGPKYATLSGITADWKIGPASGEASTLNDASVNFIAYDAIQGRYVVWTQNTLQIANSALRNIGTVLNILDIKKAISSYLTEYLQLPITTSLRKQMVTAIDNYMNTVKSQGRVSNFAFQDTSTDTDVSNNTLNFVLTLAPTYYAQIINVAITIVNQTFDFTILQNS
jgi:hypothetical protein